MRIQDALPSRGVRNRRVTPAQRPPRDAATRGGGRALARDRRRRARRRGVRPRRQGSVRDGDRDARHRAGPAPRRAGQARPGDRPGHRPRRQRPAPRRGAADRRRSRRSTPRSEPESPSRRRAHPGRDRQRARSAVRDDRRQLDRDLPVPRGHARRPAGDRPRARRRAVRPRRGQPRPSTGSMSQRPGDASSSARASTSGGRKEGAPKLLAVGGRHLLMLDDRNTVWLWRPANSSGEGTLTRVPSGVNGVVRVGRRHPGDRDVPPRSGAEPLQPVRRRPVGAAGPALLACRGRQRLPAAPTRWLSAPRDVSGITSHVHRRRHLARRWR